VNLRAGATLFGAYTLSLGVNYLPLLLHAISIVRQGTSATEIADETGDRAQLFRKYRRGSLLILLPLVVAVAAITQWRRVGASTG
jgi:hypothetical protein